MISIRWVSPEKTRESAGKTGVKALQFVYKIKKCEYSSPFFVKMRKCIFRMVVV